jgi:hypothetical protein
MGKYNDIDLRIDEELACFTKLGLNSTVLSNGTWIHNDTGKWEEPLEYYSREFEYFKPEFQKKIIYYMPTIRKTRGL